MMAVATRNSLKDIEPTETTSLLGENYTAHPDREENEVARENGNDREQGIAGDEGATPSPETTNLRLVFPAIAIGIYLGALDQTLTVSAYAKIGNELNALNNISWLATSYFLTLTAFQPLYGKLSDIFGRKECLLFAYTVFAVGCLGCGFAHNVAVLYASRAVTGIGSGGMNCLVPILLSDLVPLRDRGIWQGYIHIVFAAGTSTGAPIGGLFADTIGWRWSFLSQVPLCIIAWLVVYILLELPRANTDHWLINLRQVDVFGALTLILTVSSLLVGLDSGANSSWTNVLTLVPLCLTPVFFAAFVLVEAKVASHPFASAHIFFHPALSAGFIGNFCVVASQFSVLFFVPLFFQAVQGFSATKSGFLLVPAMISSVFAALLGGWIIKRTGRFHIISVSSYVLFLFSMLPIMLSMWFASSVGVVLGHVLNGFGLGCGITTVLIGLLAHSSKEDMAVVVASSYFFRSLGSTIGVSISSAILQQTLRDQLSARLPTNEDAGHIADRVRENLDYIDLLPPAVAAVVTRSYQVALVAAVTPTVVFALLAVLFTLRLKEKSLNK